MSASVERRTLNFWRERQTHNFVVYKEEYNRGDVPVVGTLYVRKETIREWGDPEELTVVVSPRSPREAV